jgi:hypothetical protein
MIERQTGFFGGIRAFFRGGLLLASAPLVSRFFSTDTVEVKLRIVILSHPCFSGKAAGTLTLGLDFRRSPI